VFQNVLTPEIIFILRGVKIKEERVRKLFDKRIAKLGME